MVARALESSPLERHGSVLGRNFPVSLQLEEHQWACTENARTYLTEIVQVFFSSREPISSAMDPR
jgi:hypothetical protein